MSKAENLIQTILTKPNRADDGVLANELLREFHCGFPVERLLPLLTSSNKEVVKTGAFIASELGSKAAPLLETLTKLLQYPEGHVRSDIIISMLTCTTENNRKEIAMVISMLEDPDWRIRYEIMEFMSLASLEQLKAGLKHFEFTKGDFNHVRALRWLTGEGGRSVDEVLEWLQRQNPKDQKYGVVAATRLASITRKPLSKALASENDDVSQFADSMLKILKESGEF